MFSYHTTVYKLCLTSEWIKRLALFISYESWKKCGAVLCLILISAIGPLLEGDVPVLPMASRQSLAPQTSGPYAPCHLFPPTSDAPAANTRHPKHITQTHNVLLSRSYFSSHLVFFPLGVPFFLWKCPSLISSCFMLIIRLLLLISAFFFPVMFIILICFSTLQSLYGLS